MEDAMMKTYKFLLLTIFCALSFCACSDLDLNESVYYSKEFQFSDYARVKRVMTSVYSYVPSGFASVGGTMIDCASDDAVYAPTANTIKTMYDGSWSPTYVIDDQWGGMYSGIRAANYLIANCPEDFPQSKWNEDYSRNQEQLKNYPWEAKALRAYFHMELLKRYDNIVIADTLYTEKEVNDLKTVSYDEAVTWIAAELKEAAAHLPSTYSSTYFSELGRVTKGFALAARARLLLYAASPLHNPSNDVAKYKTAALAAQDLMTATGSPYRLTREVFNAESTETIFCVRETASNVFEYANFPVGYEGGASGVCPSLNLVEAFDMADGTPFDWETNKAAILDSKLRDPRFARAILSNGDKFKADTVASYIGGANGLPKENATPTSFYLRKFVQESTNLTTGSQTSLVHFYPVFRMAELYLNYAEALFEYSGDPFFKDSQFKTSAFEAVNAVRTANSMPRIPTSVTNDEFRARLRNERRVELAFEGHRFWDLRRWKIGDQTKTIYGAQITKNADNTFNVEKVTVQSRVWDDKMYLYPMNAGELYKNHNLVQNTGW